MNLNSQIGYSLRWLLGGCFGLVLACLCMPLVGAYVTGYMREALSVMLAVVHRRGRELCCGVGAGSKDTDEPQ